MPIFTHSAHMRPTPLARRGLFCPIIGSEIWRPMSLQLQFSLSTPLSLHEDCVSTWSWWWWWSSYQSLAHLSWDADIFWETVSSLQYVIYLHGSCLTCVDMYFMNFCQKLVFSRIYSIYTIFDTLASSSSSWQTSRQPPSHAFYRFTKSDEEKLKIDKTMMTLKIGWWWWQPIPASYHHITQSTAVTV